MALETPRVKVPSFYRWVLRVCPAAFREEYGPEVLETIRLREREVRDGGSSLWRFRCRESWALVRAAWRVRQSGSAFSHTSSPGAALMSRSSPSPMSGLLSDFRLGARALRTRPGYSVVAVLTLAVACGAATAVFSVVNAVMLQPLPYAEADRLVVVRDASPPRFPSFSVSPGRFLEWPARARLFEGFAATTGDRVTLTGRGDPRHLAVARSTANLFDVLGVPPSAGRTFTVAEDRVGGQPAIILSDRIVRRLFGGDMGIIGQSITLDDEAVQVVGVMPPGFVYPSEDIDAWMPMAFTDDERTRYGSHYLRVVGRMADGVTVDAARDDLARAARDLAAEIPAGNESWTTLVDAMHEMSTRSVRGGLYLLAGAAFGVLLIACANVAGLLLARGADRQREIALRAALGAGRWRLIRQLLTESALLGFAGAALGVVVAGATLTALLSAPWASLPRVAAIPIDATSLAFAVVLALVVPLAFGALPAFQMARPAAAHALAAGGRTGATSLRSATRATLIVGEIALAVMLVSGSALLLRSLDRLMRVEPGFEPAGVMAIGVTTPGSRYPTDVARAQFLDTLLERAAALPGVTSVAATQSVPFFGDYVASLYIDGDNEPEAPFPSANFYAVTPDYFETMGVPLLRGRPFTAADTAAAPRVAIVSEQLALRVFGRPDVLGRLIRPSQGPREDFAEIVGVVGDVRHYDLDAEVGIQIYEPAHQHPYFSARQLVVRTDLAPEALAPLVRRAVRSIDERLPIAQPRLLSEAVAASTGSRRFTTALLGGLAVVALLLAAVGVYGLVSFSARRRVQEFGVRIALGAEPAGIMRLVVAQGVKLALLGVAIGLVGAVAAGRVLETLLFEVSSRDPIALGVASSVLVVSATLACVAPALSALRVDPVTALRQQ